MRLNIVSDLHLEFAPMNPRNETGADVLILSGDICVAEYFNKSEASPYFPKAQMFREFFHACANEYDHVLYVMGNHEHYSGKFSETEAILREHLPSGITLLNRGMIRIDDVNFLGTTLWTDILKGNPLAINAVETGMNDYKVIQSPSRYGKLRGMETIREHTMNLRFIDGNTSGRTVVIGHHAPSYHSIHPNFRDSRSQRINPGYYSDLDQFIWDHPQIELWTHGHVHNNADYVIGNTRIFCNPRGYNDENPEFNWHTVVEI
jgi:Icc-related predicted phosphoesterase